MKVKTMFAMLVALIAASPLVQANPLSEMPTGITILPRTTEAAEGVYGMVAKSLAPSSAALVVIGSEAVRIADQAGATFDQGSQMIVLTGDAVAELVMTHLSEAESSEQGYLLRSVSFTKAMQIKLGDKIRFLLNPFANHFNTEASDASNGVSEFFGWLLFPFCIAIHGNDIGGLGCIPGFQD